MNRQDALKALNINKLNPSEAEIKEAHREVSRRYHPDRHQNVDAVIQEAVREKFERALQARDMLIAELNRGHGFNQGARGVSSTDMPPSGVWSNDPVAYQEVEAASRFLERRQFADALTHLDRALTRCQDYELLNIKINTLGELGRHHVIERDLKDWAITYPGLNTDYTHQLLLFYSLRAQSKNNLALHKINEMINREGEVPSLLSLKAVNLVELGRAQEAEQIIARLRVIDPSNPIIAERDSSFLVGNQYVDKQGAAQEACFICILLECIFDCL